MKIKAMTKWFWSSSWSTLAVMTGVLFLVNTLSVIVQQVQGETFNNTGNDWSFAIGGFVIGCVLFSAGVRFGVTNSVSRKTIFLSLIANALVFSVLCALSSVLLMILLAIMPGQAVTSGFYMIYDAYVQAQGSVLSGLTMMLWNMAALLFMVMLGVFVGGVFYRLGKFGKVMWAAGLPVVLFGVFPVGVGLLPKEIVEQIAQGMMSLITFLGRSPFYVILAFLLMSLVVIAVNWILIRRVPLKTT